MQHTDRQTNIVKCSISACEMYLMIDIWMVNGLRIIFVLV